MTSLCDGYISDQEVGSQVTGSEGVVGGLQQREAGDAAGAALLFADHQAVSVETPTRIQIEVKNWKGSELGREGTGEVREEKGTVRNERRNFSRRRRLGGGGGGTGVEISIQKI